MEKKSKHVPDEGRRRFLKLATTTAATALTLPLVPGYIDSAMTGTALTPEQMGASEQDDTSPTLTQLTGHPTSRAAMPLLLQLTYSQGPAMLDKITGGKGPLMMTYTRDDAATQAYYASNGITNKEALYTLDILDPQKAYGGADQQAAFADPKNRIHLRMIAHHTDPDIKNDFEGAAYYNNQSQSLIIVYPGINPQRVEPMLEMMRGKSNPQLRGVDGFMDDVTAQITKQHLPVKHTVIFSHSIGSDSAVKTLAYIKTHPRAHVALGGIPKAVLFEDWKAAFTAQGCVSASKGALTLKDIADHCITIRHFPSTHMGLEQNPPLTPPIGIIKHDYTQASNLIHDPFHRNLAHRAVVTSQDLLSGYSAIYPQFKGHLQATRLFDDIAEPALTSDANHPIPARAGMLAVATAYVGTVGAVINRRMKLAEEKRQASADTPDGHRL